MKTIIFLLILSSHAWAQTAALPEQKTPAPASAKKIPNVTTVSPIDSTEPPITIQWTAPLAPFKKHKQATIESVAEQTLDRTQEINVYETWDVFQNFGKKGNQQ